MANTISQLSIANTFGEWVGTTIQTVNELNYIGNYDWHKSSGTFYIDSIGTALDVANNSYFRGSVIVTGLNSSLEVYKNATVRSVLYLTNNDVDAQPDKLIFSANGVANVNYINITGNGLSANVSNNMFIGGTLYISGNTTTNANLVVTNDITANNGSISYDFNIGEDATIGRNLTVSGITISTKDIYALESLNVSGTTRTNQLNVNTAINATSAKFNDLEVAGQFLISGPTVYSSNSFFISSQIPLTNTDVQFATFGTVRTNTNNYFANAEIRWENANKYWSIRDVDNYDENTSYQKILTANDYVVINSSITDANTKLKSYSDNTFAPKFSPTLTGVPLTPTAANGTSNTMIATTQFVQYQIDNKASFTSPLLTGTPTAPTAANGTSNTMIATTQFVQYEITNRSSFTSPVLTGSPTAPTAANGTSNTMIATTEFVQAANSILKVYADGKFANIASPALTGSPTAPTAANGTSNTMIATTEFVQAANSILKVYADGKFANIASPALTGTPTSPTAANGTSNTMIATTQFVQNANNILKVYVDGKFANIASPALTGSPTSPTAATGTSNTMIATTAFVQDANTKLKSYSDNTFATKDSPTFTGTVSTGNVSITSGTLSLATGTTSLAPLKFTAGSNLTVPVAGVAEWDGTNLYLTQTSGPTRKTLAFTDQSFYIGTTQVSINRANSSQTLEGVSISGNSGTCGNYTPSTVSGTANRIVVADNSGHIFNNYFNMTADTISSHGNIAVSNGSDNYLRWISPSNLRAGRFDSVSNPGTYWLTNTWDGSRWYITSNQGAAVRVGYADVAGTANSATYATTGPNVIAATSDDQTLATTIWVNDRFFGGNTAAVANWGSGTTYYASSYKTNGPIFVSGFTNGNVQATWPTYLYIYLYVNGVLVGRWGCSNSDSDVDYHQGAVSAVVPTGGNFRFVYNCAFNGSYIR